MPARTPVAAAIALVTLATPTSAATPSGAWKTFMHPGQFTALVARDDAVWGATSESGLYRWDRLASRFDLIRREPGAIASNHLNALALDRSGRLWAATDGAGVSRRSADGRRWDVVNVLDGLPSDTVRVLEATGDTLWIGTARGVALWNGREVSGALPDGLTASFDTTFASLSITGIVLHGDSLWLATRRGVGLARVSTGLADWRPAADGLAVTDVQSLACDGADVFALADGVSYRWREDLGRWVAEPGAGVVHRLADAPGAVLASGESGGFRWSRTATDSGWTALAGSPAAGPQSPEDPEIALAPDGRVFSALSTALEEAPASPGPWAVHPLPDGPPANDLVQVGLDRSRVYLTTLIHGVARYDGTWRIWPVEYCAGAGCDTSFLHPAFPLGLLVDGAGRKWVASWTTSLESFTDSLPTPQFVRHVVGVDVASQQRTWVWCGVQDARGGRWFGMDTPQKGDVDAIGLEYYDSTLAYVGNFNASNTRMKGNFVHGLAVTANARIWVGYDPGGLGFVVLPPSGSPSASAFQNLTATQDLGVRGVAAYGDSVWVVTNTQVLRFSGEAVGGSTAIETFPYDGAQAFLGFKPIATGPDGSVWIGSGTGGLQVFRRGGISESFTTANSPIPGDEVRAVAIDASSGVVWMATSEGLASFDPAFVTPPPPPLASLSARLYPNPAQLNGLGVQLRIEGDAESYAGAVYDLTGRKLRRFAGAANGAAVWDGRDDGGRLVPPGIYFVRVEAGGRSVTARVVLLR